MSTADRDGDLAPFDEAESAAQIDAVLALLGPPPRRVLDLGCGAGRVLAPLAAHGHEAIGVDADDAALAQAEAALARAGVAATLVRGDVTAAWPSWLPEGPPLDAVLCLGHTFMLLADVLAAVGVLREAAARLAPDGVVVLDDLLGLWTEVAEGSWQAGYAEDGRQLVWAPGDAVIALRPADAADDARWTPGPGDRPLRLWSRGALTLAAALADLSPPESGPRPGVLTMRRRRDAPRRLSSLQVK